MCVWGVCEVAGSSAGIAPTCPPCSPPPATCDLEANVEGTLQCTRDRHLTKRRDSMQLVMVHNGREHSRMQLLVHSSINNPNKLIFEPSCASVDLFLWSVGSLSRTHLFLSPVGTGQSHYSREEKQEPMGLCGASLYFRSGQACCRHLQRHWLQRHTPSLKREQGTYFIYTQDLKVTWQAGACR